MYIELSGDYQNIKYLPLMFGLKMYISRKEKAEDNKLWDIYLVNFSKMDEKTYKSFEEWKRKIKTPCNPKKSKEELINQAEQVKRQHQKRLEKKQ